MLKKKKSKTTKGLTIWTKPKDGKPNIQSEYSRASLKDFLKKHDDEWVKMVFSPMSRPKSAEALGYLYGALYPFYIAKRRGLHFEPNNIDVLLKDKQITVEEIEEVHFTFMLEFRPMMVFDLKTGKPVKQRGELKKYNNTQLIAYITEVIEYLTENYGEVPNPEEYKKIRDLAKLVKEEGLKEIEYPTENYSPENIPF